MIRWLRVVMPPWWAVLLPALCYIGLEVFTLINEWRYGARFYSLNVGMLFVGMMGSIVFWYAVYRVLAFHPALRPKYFNWLAGTPWTCRKPLPLGPVHLVLQDLLILGVAVGLSWPRCGLKSLEVLKAFLAGYVSILCIVHAFTGQKGWAYVVAVGIGFMGLFALSPLFYVAAGITYALAILGLRASLARFPWDNVPQFQLLHSDKSNAQSKYKGMLGWPFERLGPGFPNDFPFSLGSPILNGLVAGWWFFVVAYHVKIRDFESHGAFIMSLFILALPVLARIGIYCDGYMPPLSLRGRFALGQLIIPGYDRIFVAPLLAVLVFVALGMLSLWSGIPIFIALSIGVTTTWWILFGMGPSLDAWRLTGNHRIVKGMMANAGQRK